MGSIFRFPAICLLALTFLLVAQSGETQVAELCAAEEGPAQLACLRQAVIALEASKDVTERALLRLANEIEALRSELRGPTKVVEAIAPVGVAVVKHVRLGGETECSPPPPARDGFTLIGVELGPEQTLAQIGTCTPPGINCFGLAGVCVFRSRSGGCYVNTEWLVWHQERPGVSMRVEEVCR